MDTLSLECTYVSKWKNILKAKIFPELVDPWCNVKTNRAFRELFFQNLTKCFRMRIRSKYSICRESSPCLSPQPLPNYAALSKDAIEQWKWTMPIVAVVRPWFSPIKLLYCIVTNLLCQKDLNLLKKHTKNQEASSISRVGFTLSNWPHLHKAYVVTVPFILILAV